MILKAPREDGGRVVGREHVTYRELGARWPWTFQAGIRKQCSNAFNILRQNDCQQLQWSHCQTLNISKICFPPTFSQECIKGCAFKKGGSRRKKSWNSGKWRPRSRDRGQGNSRDGVGLLQEHSCAWGLDSKQGSLEQVRCPPKRRGEIREGEHPQAFTGDVWFPWNIWEWLSDSYVNKWRVRKRDILNIQRKWKFYSKQECNCG